MRMVITAADYVPRVLQNKALGVCHGVVSIGEPDWTRPECLRNATFPVLTLGFDDCEQDIGDGSKHADMKAPTWEDVQKIIDFAETIPRLEYGYVLSHCMAGISRSSAAMAIMLVARSPKLAGLEAFKMIKQQCENAYRDGLRPDWGISPNRRMVWMADELLNRRWGFGTACEWVYYRGDESFDLSTLPARVERVP